MLNLTAATRPLLWPHHPDDMREEWNEWIASWCGAHIELAEHLEKIASQGASGQSLQEDLAAWHSRLSTLVDHAVALIHGLFADGSDLRPLIRSVVEAQYFPARERLREAAKAVQRRSIEVEGFSFIVTPLESSVAMTPSGRRLTQ